MAEHETDDRPEAQPDGHALVPQDLDALAAAGYGLHAVNAQLPSGAVISGAQARAVSAILRGHTRAAASAAAGVKEGTLYKWLRHDEAFQEALQVNARASFQLAQLDAASVLGELWKILQVTMQDLFDEDGHPIPVHRLPRHVAGAVREYDVEVVEDQLPDGTTRITRRGKAKLLSRQQALDRLGDYLRLWAGDGGADSRKVEFVVDGLNGPGSQDVATSGGGDSEEA